MFIFKSEGRISQDFSDLSVSGDNLFMVYKKSLTVTALLSSLLSTVNSLMRQSADGLIREIYLTAWGRRRSYGCILSYCLAVITPDSCVNIQFF